VSFRTAKKRQRNVSLSYFEVSAFNQWAGAQRFCERFHPIIWVSHALFFIEVLEKTLIFGSKAIEVTCKFIFTRNLGEDGLIGVNDPQGLKNIRNRLSGF